MSIADVIIWYSYLTSSHSGFSWCFAFWNATRWLLGWWIRQTHACMNLWMEIVPLNVIKIAVSTCEWNRTTFWHWNVSLKILVVIKARVLAVSFIKILVFDDLLIHLLVCSLLFQTGSISLIIFGSCVWESRWLSCASWFLFNGFSWLLVRTSSQTQTRIKDAIHCISSSWSRWLTRWVIVVFVWCAWLFTCSTLSTVYLSLLQRSVITGRTICKSTHSWPSWYILCSLTRSLNSLAWVKHLVKIVLCNSTLNVFLHSRLTSLDLHSSWIFFFIILIYFNWVGEIMLLVYDDLIIVKSCIIGWSNSIMEDLFVFVYLTNHLTHYLSRFKSFLGTNIIFMCGSTSALWFRKLSRLTFTIYWIVVEHIYQGTSWISKLMLISILGVIHSSFLRFQLCLILISIKVLDFSVDHILWNISSILCRLSIRFSFYSHHSNCTILFLTKARCFTLNNIRRSCS